MNIESTKLQLMQLLLQTEKESILTKLMNVFKEEKEDWWNDLSNIEKEQLEIGLREAEEGKTIDHETVMDQFRKWH